MLLLLTGGSNNQKYMKKFEEEIKRYNIEISASYQCRGYDTFGIFKIIGGIAKGHPNDADIAEASDIMKKWLIS